jgi:chaperonin GroES
MSDRILSASIDENLLSIRMDETCGIRPLGDFCLVRNDRPAEVSPGGLTIPEQARLRPQTGVVLAVGPGEKLPSGERSPVMVRPGMRVYFGAQFGTRIQDHDDLHIVREGAILAIKDES